jgi:hypothetical protein
MADILTVNPVEAASLIRKTIGQFMPKPTQKMGFLGTPVTASNGATPAVMAGGGVTLGGVTTLPNENNLIQIEYTNEGAETVVLFFGSYLAFLSLAIKQQIVNNTPELAGNTANIIISSFQHENLLLNCQSMGMLGVLLDSVTWTTPGGGEQTAQGEFIKSMTIPGTNTQPVFNSFKPSGLVKNWSYNKNIIEVKDGMVYNMGNEQNFIISVRPTRTLSFNLTWNALNPQG